MSEEYIVLVVPDESMEREAIEFREEFFQHGEHMICGSYKWDMNKYSYKEWLQIIRDNLDESKMNPKFGMSNTCFAMNQQNKIVGIINFRHTITEFYKNSGQIGYSVRPSERRKGYAVEMLQKVCLLAKQQGLTELYIVCQHRNEGSKRTILKNGGSLHRQFVEEDTIYEEYSILL